MPVNFNAMILPQIGTAMMEGSAARENSMLKNQQMANSQQEMAMRQQKFGREEAEIKYILSERDRVNGAYAQLSKNIEDNGGVPGPDAFRAMVDSRVPQMVQMGMTGFQMLKDKQELDGLVAGLTRIREGTQPQPAQAGRSSIIPPPAPPANFSPAPMAAPAAPTNALAPRELTREDLMPLAASTIPGANRLAALLTPTKTAGPETLQLLEKLKNLNPESPEAIRINKRLDYLTSVEARQQPQRPDLGTAEGAPGAPRVAYQITPGRDGPKVNAVPIPGTEQPTQSEKLDVKQRAKLDAAYPKANAAFRFSDNKLDTLIKDVISLKENPGLGGVTGLVYGRIPGITDAARSAEADIEALKARGGFNELREMRIQSPTGGALGNVSNREGDKLEAAFAALKQTQSTDDYKKKLALLLSQLKVSKALIKQAFDEEYGYKQGDNAPPAQPAAGGKPDDVEGLPAGASIGKSTSKGMEVLDSTGKLIGYAK